MSSRFDGDCDAVVMGKYAKEITLDGSGGSNLDRCARHKKSY